MFTQIRPLVFVAGIAAMLMGCSPEASTEASGGGVDVDMGGVGDLAPTVARCPAAQGVEGDVLLCADFAKIQTIEKMEAAGWSFDFPSSINCWQIADNELQNVNTDKIDAPSCGLFAPGVDFSDYPASKFDKINLVISYKTDFVYPQYGYIELVGPGRERLTDGWLLVIGNEDIKNVSKKQILTIERKKLPSKLNYLFSPYFRLTTLRSQTVSKGWQISSLAIVGSY